MRPGVVVGSDGGGHFIVVVSHSGWFVRRMVMRIRRIGRGPLTRRPPLPPRPPPHRPRLLQVNEWVKVSEGVSFPVDHVSCQAKGQRMTVEVRGREGRHRSKRSTLDRKLSGQGGQHSTSFRKRRQRKLPQGYRYVIRNLQACHN